MKNHVRALSCGRLANDTLCVVALYAVLCLPMAALADQPSATGGIRGVVTDQTGAVLRGARVEIKHIESARTETTATDQDGRYAFERVTLGLYEVSAAFTGFETSVRTRTAVAAHQDTVVDFSLNLGRSQSVVEVTAAAAVEGGPDSLRTYDTATLLDGIAGLSVYTSGGVSGLPAIHGMADDRVNVLVNGMSISSACSNHMNPPLSYIAPSNVGRVSVMAGITPVSRGGDSIGGSIAVDAATPEFAGAGDRLVTHGSVSLTRRSSAITTGGNASASLATRNFRVAYNGAYVDADNYTSGDGARVRSTFYEAANHAVQMAGRRGRGVTTIDLSLQSIPQQGFVNARMDMTRNRATSANLSHDAEFDWGRLLGRAYYVGTTHEMNILRDKIPGMNMPMNSEGANIGLSVKADLVVSPRNALRVGYEFHRFLLDDWWPPVSAAVGSMGPNTLWNVRDGRRDRFGTYAEWEAKRGRAWTALVGIRGDIVRMNTGDVTGYNMSPTTTASAAYYLDATEFNARDRRRRDNNVDVTALARYGTEGGSSFAVGYARKTRSPNLYERYLWVKRSNMSVRMNGWFGDANGYAGNLDLRPEVANTLSGTAGWRSRAARGWELTITPYYTAVRDFIDVERCAAIAGSNGCTAANLTATTGFVNLQFVNDRARLYGVDGSGRAPLGSTPTLGAFELSGVIGYVRGTNLETGDNLYQMMPLKAKLTLEHHRGAWSGAVDLQTVAAKRHVQAVRNELRTGGYTLVGARGRYAWQFLQLDAGIDNLTDRDYDLPLGGRYWVGDRTGASPVPGMGRSFFGGLTVKF